MAAAVVYAWNISENPLHSYYGPAVRSMSESWKAMLFAAYDPEASVTLDKLPGALVVQALSARIFGYHVWSVIAPQVAEAVTTILVLYRVVRSWQGPAAGLLAAAGYATMPIVAALARSEISDTLLVMLLVLAADGWTRAMRTGRLRPMVLAGVLIGLAFQAKMVQAWGIVPALALAYLVAAPVALRSRLLRLGVTGLVTAVVSLSWVALLTLLPASVRPYVDGSPDNSALYMVFQYNLLGRYDAATSGSSPGSEGGWDYLLGQSVATQVGWLYPLAVAGLAAGLAFRGRWARTDQVRAGYLMWGLWLATHIAAFAMGRVAHTYYVVAVAPAVAALAAGGTVTLWLWFRAGRDWRCFALPVVVGITLMWTIYLCSGYPDFRPWTRVGVMGLGGVAILALVGTIVLREGNQGATRLMAVGGSLAVAAVLVTPALWAVSTVDEDYAGSSHGPAAGPSSSRGGNASRSASSGGRGSSGGSGGSSSGSRSTSQDIGDEPTDQVAATVAYLTANEPGSRYVLAVQGATLAGQYLMTGQSILPMGGYSGNIPFPTVDQIARLVGTGELRYVLLGSEKDGGGDEGDDVTTWVVTNCSSMDASGTQVYDCRI